MRLLHRLKTTSGRAAAWVALCAIAFCFAPSRANAAPPTDAPSYTVQAGDTLFSIALRYHTTVAQLKQLNGLSGDMLQVGQKLVLPGAAGSAAAPAPAASGDAFYIVQTGDSLYRIALRYGTTLRALADLNDLPNPDLISIGQALTIPRSAAVVKPGLVIDPPNAHQGDTVLIRVARPNLVTVIGKFNGKTLQFTDAGDYQYALAGISRCARLGNYPLTLSETDAA